MSMSMKKLRQECRVQMSTNETECTKKKEENGLINNEWAHKRFVGTHDEPKKKKNVSLDNSGAQKRKIGCCIPCTCTHSHTHTHINGKRARIYTVHTGASCVAWLLFACFVFFGISKIFPCVGPSAYAIHCAMCRCRRYVCLSIASIYLHSASAHKYTHTHTTQWAPSISTHANVIRTIHNTSWCKLVFLFIFLFFLGSFSGCTVKREYFAKNIFGELQHTPIYVFLRIHLFGVFPLFPSFCFSFDLIVLAVYVRPPRVH